MPMHMKFNGLLDCNCKILYVGIMNSNCKILYVGLKEPVFMSLRFLVNYYRNLVFCCLKKIDSDIQMDLFNVFVFVLSHVLQTIYCTFLFYFNEIRNICFDICICYCFT